MPARVKMVVSGGQTGADRAGFDAALELGLETGGWIPKGRLAEDGAVPESYSNLKETPSPSYQERTEMNVRDSDATAIFSRGGLTGGSLLTMQLAERYGRPAIHIDLETMSVGDGAKVLNKWLKETECRTLNVAGPRASSDPEIYGLVKRLIVAALENEG